MRSFRHLLFAGLAMLTLIVVAPMVSTMVMAFEATASAALFPPLTAGLFAVFKVPIAVALLAMLVVSLVVLLLLSVSRPRRGFVERGFLPAGLRCPPS